MPQTPLKVLVVDDDEGLREVVTTIMDILSVPYLAVENAFQALEHIQSGDYRLVLTDIMMPGMSGTQLLEKCLALGIMTPFVFMTGLNDQRLVIKAVRMGAIDFLEKPFSGHDLEEVLTRTLAIADLWNDVFGSVKIREVKTLEEMRHKMKRMMLIRSLGSKAVKESDVAS